MHHPSRITLLALLLLAACTPPAPTPPAETPPTPAADLAQYTPWPAVILTPGTHPAPPDNRPSPTPEPYMGATPATAAPLQEETVTPVATATETPEVMGIEPLPPEPQPTVEPRGGVANANGGGVALCDGRQYQTWWSSGYITSPCFQHIPMLANKPGNLEAQKAINTAARMNHHYWLVFNECEHQEQCAATPEEAARYYHDVLLPFINGLDPAARLIIGGSNAGECGLAWMAEFVEFYEAEYQEEIPRAGWSFHPYPEIWAGSDCTHPWQWDWARSSSLVDLWDAWQAQARGVKAFVLTYGREGDEIWFSELGCLSPPPSVCHSDSANLARLIVEWLNGEGLWVDRATWYSDHDNNWWWFTHLYEEHANGDEGDVLTAVGEIWLNAELSPSIPLEFHKRYFPIVGYRGGLSIDPTPAPVPTPTPPAYPVPGDLHP